MFPDIEIGVCTDLARGASQAGQEQCTSTFLEDSLIKKKKDTFQNIG